jgi:hypothetical protein
MKGKKLLVLLVIALITTMGAASALAAPVLNYTSCFQVQNLDGAQTAAISVSYYEQGVASPTVVNDTVAAAGSKTYCPLSAVSDGFDGSVVISSDVEVAAIANISGAESGDPNWTSYNASYTGFTAGATTVNLPLLFKNNSGFDTFFNVQNAGTDTANVTVNYSDGAPDAMASIGPGQAHTFRQADEAHTQAIFAATITSNQPVVATVIEVGPSNMPMLFGYNGFTNSSTNPVMPLVQANNSGYTSGIQIQNTGAAATNVTLTYLPATAGTQCTETHSIAPGASATYALNAWAAGDANADNTCVNGQTFIGSARVTANSASVGLVGIVNQHSFGANKGASYGAFNPANATNTVVMPLIMDRNSDYWTGFNVQNVGAAATTVNCTFANTGYTASATLQPYEALNDIQFNNIASGYVGSAVCTSSGQPIIGVVNELRNVGTQDTLLTYEGANN